MEFVRKKRETAKDSPEDIRRRLLNWPDCFYRERDAKIRKMLLDEADKEGLTPEENEIRRHLFELRYPENGAVKDTFLRAWLEVRFLRENNGNFLFRSKGPTKIIQILDEIGFADLGDDRTYKGLLYQEVYHLGMLYASLCQEDKGYSSVIFGIGTMSEDKLANKIGAEFRDVAVNIPARFGVTGKYTLWTDALSDAFCDMFPEKENAFRSKD